MLNYQRTGGGDDDNDERMIKFEEQCRTVYDEVFDGSADSSYGAVAYEEGYEEPSAPVKDRKPDRSELVFQGNNAVTFHERLQGRSATMFLARFKNISVLMFQDKNAERLQDSIQKCSQNTVQQGYKAKLFRRKNGNRIPDYNVTVFSGNI